MIALLFILSVFHCSYEYDYEIRFFPQQVDHFSYSNKDYFLQRYLISFKYWRRNNGPIFFYTGNEGDITMFANNTGFMWEQASLYNALVVFAEHRYYGASLPYGDQSFKTLENRGYLNSEQALADFANLIYNLKKNLSYTANSPVIAFGGSYGGMLAAWMRIKYPHIVAGAISSSAPILQLSNVSICGRFAEIVSHNFNQSGFDCFESIRKSWGIIRSIGSTTTGIKWLSSNFRLCSSISHSQVSDLIHWLEDNWNFLAMLNYPYETNFVRPMPAFPIKEACQYLQDSKQPDKVLLNNIYKAVSIFQNFTGDVPCFNISVSGKTLLGDSGWSYQSCTEFVMPMCQNGVDDMFEPVPWNFKKYTLNCENQWQVSPDFNRANIIYGGYNISAASNIFFSNGNLDPWSAGGFLTSLSDTIIAFVIDDAAHHLDLRAYNAADPESVLKARRMESYWLKKWVFV